MTGRGKGGKGLGKGAKRHRKVLRNNITSTRETGKATKGSNGDLSDGSIFGGGSSVFGGGRSAVFGGESSVFGGGSSVFGTLSKSQAISRANSIFGPPAVRMMRTDIPSSVVSQAPRSIPSSSGQLSSGPDHPKSSSQGASPPNRPVVPEKKSYKAELTRAETVSQSKDLGHSQSLGYSQAPPNIKKENCDDIKEEDCNDINKIDCDDINKENCDDIPADALLKQLLNMQNQQLTELLPELREREEKSEQILDSARLVMKDIKNYDEKLSGIKQQYYSRLSQVSSFLSPENDS
eukprot:GFUD01003734.1.p1 GENE.GFUD01003734.1~~GFUD01003734.1.p1  ORF type:complete len:293 (+),score=108.25 GFUD01003734.1:32-910(+)